MMRAPTGWKAAWLTAGLLCVAALVMLVCATVGHLHRSRLPTRVEAQAQAAAARKDLERAMRATKWADRVSQQALATNSTLYQDIRSAGNALVQNLREKTAIAATEAELADRVEAATQCVQRCAEYNRAQVARAALALSGLKQAVIRPADPTKQFGEQDSFQIMVAAEDVDAARGVLQGVHLSQLNFASAPSAVQAMQTLKARGIQATVGFLHGPDWVKGSEPLFAVFVSSADAESARKIIGRAASEAEF